MDKKHYVKIMVKKNKWYDITTVLSNGSKFAYIILKMMKIYIFKEFVESIMRFIE